MATDPDGDALTYRLEGTDALVFNIDENTGVVSFRNAPDYENPGDEDRNNVYEIAVTATDSDGLRASQNVTIYVVHATPGAQQISFAQPGPFNLMVGDTLSNVASGGLGTGVISYSSSDTTIATVDATGQLTVVGAGIAMITAEKAADAQSS